MHEEVADVLYRSLTFIGMKPLRRFLRDRQESYLRRVHTIHVQWEGIVRSLPAFNLDFEDWPTTCARLAELHGLRYLAIRIFVCNRTSARLADLFLRPLKVVQEVNVEASVVRNCWDGHPKQQQKRVAEVLLGEFKVPIRVCEVHLPAYTSHDLLLG
jgi:hypothetical protein